METGMAASGINLALSPPLAREWAFRFRQWEGLYLYIYYIINIMMRTQPATPRPYTKEDYELVVLCGDTQTIPLGLRDQSGPNAALERVLAAFRTVGAALHWLCYFGSQGAWPHGGSGSPARKSKDAARRRRGAPEANVIFAFSSVPTPLIGIGQDTFCS
jgi:hypothetical protein